MTIIWCMVRKMVRFGMQHTEFFVIPKCFLPFYLSPPPPPPMDPENQNFQNMKKTPEDIIILQMCIINDSYVLFLRYGVQQTESFVIFNCFLLFYTPPTPPPTPPTTWKIIIFKNWEKSLEILSLYICVPKVTYDVWWFLRYWSQQTEFFVILDHLLPFYPLKVACMVYIKLFFYGLILL